MTLAIGPGFEQWIADHQATPETDELFFSAELSCIMVSVADSSGATVKMLLYYNKMTNEIVPFVQATL